jgi:hypothetical protein
MAEQIQPTTTKCARVACADTTETPTASGWIYMDRSVVSIAMFAIMRSWPALSQPVCSTGAAETPDWVGWWCSQCIQELDRMSRE